MGHIHETTQAELVEQLSRTEAYPRRPASVELVRPSELTDRHVLHAQTHTDEPAEETTAQTIDKLIGQTLS